MEASPEWVRVGRRMSQEELTDMRVTGFAQESKSLGGGSRVTLPPNPDAYKAAPAGDVYVEYDVPAGVAKLVGSGLGQDTGAWQCRGSKRGEIWPADAGGASR